LRGTSGFWRVAPDGFTRVYNPDMPVDVPHCKGCVDLHIMAR
jgi:hypothetical protein